MKNETIYVTQNNYFFKEVRVLNPDGTPIDLTGYTVSMLIQKYFGDNMVYSADCNIANVLTGDVIITISSEGTKYIPSGTYQYSIFMSQPNSETITILQGQLVVNPSVF